MDVFHFNESNRLFPDVSGVNCMFVCMGLKMDYLVAVYYSKTKECCCLNRYIVNVQLAQENVYQHSIIVRHLHEGT